MAEKKGFSAPLSNDNGGTGPKVALIKLHGAIMEGKNPQQQLINFDNVKPQIDAVRKMEDIKAIALDINSPGGSPVECEMIGGALRELAAAKGVPVYAFVRTVAASGGYWLACCADEIYTQPSSIVGSIGVVSAGFGFDKLIEKVGVERRVNTAGKSKVTTDQFMPVNPDGKEAIQTLQGAIHSEFINWVKSRRPSLSTKQELFDGSIFTGRTAMELGLTDGIARMDQFLKARFGENVQIVNAKPAAPFGLPGMFNMFSSGGGVDVQSIAQSVTAGALDAVSDRIEADASKPIVQARMR